MVVIRTERRQANSGNTQETISQSSFLYVACATLFVRRNAHIHTQYITEACLPEKKVNKLVAAVTSEEGM